MLLTFNRPPHHVLRVGDLEIPGRTPTEVDDELARRLLDDPRVAVTASPVAADADDDDDVDADPGAEPAQPAAEPFTDDDRDRDPDDDQPA